MKDKLINLIKSNYPNLTDKETDEIATKMCALLPIKAQKLSEIKAGEKFKYKGYEFTKLSDERDSCYCLLNDTVFESKFGDNNDWAKSPIRKQLNGFDNKGESKVLPKINIDDLVEVELNYHSYKNPNGRVKDKITLLSWEEWYTYYYAFDFDIKGYESWLRSGGRSSAYFADSVNSGGSDTGCSVTDLRAVRPALHLKADLEVEA